ncbi:MAG: hypothetical protein AMXMBFR82_03390 [Candidatus Hydrogenedentota bacterium]|jgi:hypothetical protein
MTRIPKTDSVDELAQFWDTHDITEFEDELRVVSEPLFVRKDSIVVQIALDHKEADALHRLAQSRGVDDADLLKEWVSEKLETS